jgi:hypothetical protein
VCLTPTNPWAVVLPRRPSISPLLSQVQFVYAALFLFSAHLFVSGKNGANKGNKEKEETPQASLLGKCCLCIRASAILNPQIIGETVHHSRFPLHSTVCVVNTHAHARTIWRVLLSCSVFASLRNHSSQHKFCILACYSLHFPSPRGLDQHADFCPEKTVSPNEWDAEMDHVPWDQRHDAKSLYAMTESLVSFSGPTKFVPNGSTQHTHRMWTLHISLFRGRFSIS